MQTEDLLKDRWKVLSDYPFSPYRIGDIVESTLTRVLLTVTKEYSEFHGQSEPVENYVHPSRLEEYPALFRKLHWWEDRDISEMPEYLKVTENNIVSFHKIIKWHGIIAYETDKSFFTPEWSYEPATEADYLTYQNKNKW